MSILLRPFSTVYGLATALRNSLYDRRILSSYRSKIPVISIGNATVGGTGKTPLVIFLAQALKHRGYSPIVLSRGYGAKVVAPRIVTRDDTAAQVGDEPLLIFASGVPVIVSPDRVAGVKRIEAEQLGDVVLLDDGLQHRRLERTINIMTADCSSDRAIDEFIAGKILPEGWFREHRSGALRRADLILLNHRVPRPRAVNSERIRTVLPAGVPVFRSFIELGAVCERTSGAVLPPLSPVVALCALGNPEGFFSTVEYSGAIIVKRIAARDHSAFSAESLHALSREHPEASLVCSSKDAVKLPTSGAPAIFVLNTALEVEDDGEFFAFIERSLQTNHRG